MTRSARIRLLALLVAATFALSGAAQAGADTGGIFIGDRPQAERTASGAQARVAPSQARFGSRVLRKGMRGEDVRVLNAIIRSQPFARGVRLNDAYHGGTLRAVRHFQRRNALRPSGVVARPTVRALAGSMNRGGATWYGPGLYGNQTACGQTLRVRTVGVAHRSLPCGTRVTFRHGGRSLVTRVIDRGPFVGGVKWDLTNGARQKLGFSGSGPIRFAVAR